MREGGGPVEGRRVRDALVGVWQGAYSSIPSKFVIKVPVTGQALRAEEPFARSAVVARQLASPGVGTGQRVAIEFGDSIDFTVTLKGAHPLIRQYCELRTRRVRVSSPHSQFNKSVARTNKEVRNGTLGLMILWVALSGATPEPVDNSTSECAPPRRLPPTPRTHVCLLQGFHVRRAFAYTEPRVPLFRRSSLASHPGPRPIRWPHRTCELCSCCPRPREWLHGNHKRLAHRRYWT